MSWLELTGTIEGVGAAISVDVSLRGESLGSLMVDLRVMAAKNDLAWLKVVAEESKAKAATG